ncbi:hypothetical protein JTE90_003866 [Oedothorax gibbosus]|uniref:Kazal-like domain-containing protein n=1 Tax=Oedothorax gibbosus TaxID=931172 RepID=A0AAV6UHA4_9ARAC|nr:hypothetical protein JTE90_003866 [Oedothorax gibbosus]
MSANPFSPAVSSPQITCEFISLPIYGCLLDYSLGTELGTPALIPHSDVSRHLTVNRCCKKTMHSLAAIVVLCFGCCTGFAVGQLQDPDLFEPVLDYDILPGLESTDYVRVRDDRERRFLGGLVIEAGRHTLFPELYSPEAPHEVASVATPQEGLDQVGSNPFDVLSSDTKPGPIKFYETSGQPELEQSYLNRVNRRGRWSARKTARSTDPCAGVTERSTRVSASYARKTAEVPQKELAKQKEYGRSMEEGGRSPSVSAGPWSKCHGKHYLCPTRCLDISDPVCASDGRVYSNVCVMRKNNCGKLLQVLPLKSCYGDKKQWKRGDSPCPEQCPEVPEPACGSDGVIYFNECFMRLQTCRTGIVSVRMENCARVPRCPEVCLPIYDPVCGSDGQLYINQCRMLQQNCGKSTKKMPESFCSSVEQGKNSK